ncbi:MAG TPA: PatB family C-S lyase [Verrucomicrobiales bacterium]|nr:PatB family C-S lyase [Verrucomicrobiales bacterium]
MPSPFDQVINRTGTGSLKWSRYEGRDVLPMWVADMDFASPAPIVAALQRRVAHGCFGYSTAHPGVADSVCRHLQNVHGVTIDPSWIVWMPGMVVGLAMCACLAGEPGDEIITFTPVYPPFLKVHHDARRKLVTVPLANDNERYTFDFDAMEKAVTPRTRMVLLCSPHNPVGRVWTRAELDALADFCVRHELLLISDEIHCDLLLEPETAPHVPLLKLEGPVRQRTITLMAASKTFNVPGLGLSFAIIPDDSLRRRFALTKNTFVAEISPLSFHATQAAFSECEEWRQSLCQYLRGNRDRIAAFMAEKAPAVRMPHIEATYLAWLDVRALNLPQPASAHFEAHGLALNNGADFGSPGYVRLNFGCPRSTLEEGLRRFEAALPR